MEPEELELNLDELDQIETNSDKKLQVKNRFQELANAKRTLSQENAEKDAKLKEASEARAQAEKQVEFYKNFSQVSSKHPEAANYQEQILERVNKGIDMEEATVAVLHKEGKLGSYAPPAPPQPSPVGGSAMTQISDGDKSPNDMSQNDKLTALLELEKTGELTQALRQGINRS